MQDQYDKIFTNSLKVNQEFDDLSVTKSLKIEKEHNQVDQTVTAGFFNSDMDNMKPDNDIFQHRSSNQLTKVNDKEENPDTMLNFVHQQLEDDNNNIDNQFDKSMSQFSSNSSIDLSNKNLNVDKP